jgi:hypothetical protein
MRPSCATSWAFSLLLLLVIALMSHYSFTPSAPAVNICITVDMHVTECADAVQRRGSDCRSVSCAECQRDQALW